MKKSLSYSRPEPEVELWARWTTPAPSGLESEDVRDLETHHGPPLVMTCTDQSGMKPIQRMNDSSSATSRDFCGPRCPEAQLCWQHFALLSSPPPLPWLCNAKTHLLRRGEKDGEGEEQWGAAPRPVLEGQVWGASHPKGKAWDVRCREVLIAAFVSPCPCQSQSWGGGEAGGTAWKHPNLLSDSKRPAAAEDRASSTTWKEWLCRETPALDARLRCLTPCQGRAWAPRATGMSVWTEGW